MEKMPPVLGCSPRPTALFSPHPSSVPDELKSKGSEAEEKFSRLKALTCPKPLDRFCACTMDPLLPLDTMIVLETSWDTRIVRVAWSSDSPPLIPDTSVVAFAVTDPVILLYGHENTNSELDEYIVAPSGEMARPWFNWMMSTVVSERTSSRTTLEKLREYKPMSC